MTYARLLGLSISFIEALAVIDLHVHATCMIALKTFSYALCFELELCYCGSI